MKCFILVLFSDTEFGFMDFKKHFIVVFLLVFCFASCKNYAQDETNQTRASRFDFSSVETFKKTKETGQIVNDYGDVFTYDEVKALGNLLYDYAERTTRQIVVVTVDSIQPYSDIQKYASDLGNYWGVGQKGKDNGLVILFCKPCRKVAIATGYGTERALTDSVCKQVIDQAMIPEFREGDYYAGIHAGILELIEKWNP